MDTRVGWTTKSPLLNVRDLVQKQNIYEHLNNIVYSLLIVFSVNKVPLCVSSLPDRRIRLDSIR